MSQTSVVPPSRSWWTPFRCGLAAGVLLPVAGLVLIWALFKVSAPDLQRPPFNVEVVSTGADVTRHGGRHVVVGNERGYVVQTCNGACDDLRLQESSADNSYWVRVLDERRNIRAGEVAGYVTGGYGAWIARFDVGGRDQFQVRHRDLNADGSNVVLPADAAKH